MTVDAFEGPVIQFTAATTAVTMLTNKGRHIEDDFIAMRSWIPPLSRLAPTTPRRQSSLADRPARENRLQGFRSRVTEPAPMQLAGDHFFALGPFC
ncbi:conserved hypothetical protein [Mesorhizobium delmotii]|uniref:Uncharacterized protein n=1 Tax=Mesorhizobium delmotii TaxID=1631247 RepID=A0A2P9ALD7_9HYPH|nr:conserved hypothetical protein [Mesorhizobium delmotii]